MKYLFRYLIFVGVPYVIARKIEKAYLQSLKLKNDIDTKPDNLVVDTDKKAELKIRGGSLSLATMGIVAFLMKDFAFRTALSGLIGSTIWSDTADTAVEQILKYSSAILATPGFKFTNISKKLLSIKSDHTLDIKEILLEKNISNKEKLELIILKVQYALKNLKGRKRAVFIATVLALLAFFLGNGTPAFTYFMAGLREVLGGKDDEDSIRDYIIDLYREYNAPLPEELVTMITNEL
jgi:hypothetical protein